MENVLLLGESILEQMADAVIYADRSGRIMRWNHAAALLFGFSATEARGQNLDLIIPEHLRERHWRGFEAAMKGCRPAAGPPNAHPRDAQDRPQTLRQDDVRACQRRFRGTTDRRGCQ
jgi:PAS domain S-box-containing protein